MRSFNRPGVWVVLLVVCFALPLLQLLTRPQPIQSDSHGQNHHSSSAIAVTGDGQLVLTANPDSNSLSILDTVGPTLLTEVTVGLNPQSVAVSADNSLAYISNKDSGSLSVVDLADRRVTAEIALGSRPQGVAVSPNGRFLAVAELGDDRVRFLEAVTLRTAGLVSVADRPYGLAFTPDGQYLLVTHLLSGEVTVLPVRPYARYLPAVAMSGVPAVGPMAVARTPPAVIATWPNVAPAPAVVVNSAGTRAYLPQTMANGLGLNTQFDNTVFPKVSVLNLEDWSHQTSEHISLPETDQPVGLPWAAALARGDTELWVVNSASNNVSVIDITQPTIPLRQAHIEVGDNPRGIAFSPDGLTAYVNNTLAGTVVAIDTEAYSVTAIIPVTNIPLPPLLLSGKRHFFSSARPELAQAAWISCNTCHIEGEHDGRTWLLQYIDWEPAVENPLSLGFTPVITRNSTSLLGMIETYPLRWSAEWNESADSEFSIRFEQFGTGLIPGEMHPPLGQPNQGRSLELDQLAAFIDSLALPQRGHSLTAAEERGRLVFESPQTECLVCHPPPLYTDLQQHDVGTADAPGELFGPDIDTPSLRFLYDSGPYLHDGSAATLLDVLTIKNPADEHGRTSHLSPAELADLVAFMLALPFQE